MYSSSSHGKLGQVSALLLPGIERAHFINSVDSILNAEKFTHKIQIPEKQLSKGFPELPDVKMACPTVRMGVVTTRPEG